MKLEWTPEKLIDRDAERDLFQAMLSFRDDTRLLTIRDEGGLGKSALLRRLEYDVQFAVDAVRHVALLPLDQLTDPTEFGWVEFARDKLGRNAPFTKFDFVMRARAQRRDDVFNPDAARTHAAAGALNAQAATLGGTHNIFAGVYAPVTTTGPVNITAGRLDWTAPDQEKQARNACVDAFLADLKEICATTPVILLMDAWERCSASLQRWIHTDFLKTQCFDVNRRPKHLVLVIAGRQVPPFPEGYERFVTSVSKLGEWDEVRVLQFLEVHGYKDIRDSDIHYISVKLKEGWSLQKALNMVEQYVKAS